jgi:hypothetical protein
MNNKSIGLLVLLVLCIIGAIVGTVLFFMMPGSPVRADNDVIVVPPGYDLTVQTKDTPLWKLRAQGSWFGVPQGTVAPTPATPWTADSARAYVNSIPSITLYALYNNTLYTSPKSTIIRNDPAIFPYHGLYDRN